MLRNNKLKFFTLYLWVSLIIVGCQNNNLNFDNNVTSIEIYEWNRDELIYTMDDVDIINELIIELDKARTLSTAAMDFQSPDFELFFKEEDKTVLDIGYYKLEMELNGLKGQYWDEDEDVFFGVDLQMFIK